MRAVCVLIAAISLVACVLTHDPPCHSGIPETRDPCNGLDDDCDGQLDEDPACPTSTGSHTACVAGTCVTEACGASFADCNLDGRDSCETDLRSASLDCGACGHACGGDEYCLGGSCAPLLRRAYVFCGTTCVLEQDGEVRCAGRNTNGLLGDPALADSTALAPVGVPPLRDIVLLGAAACGVSTVGDDVWCWGNDEAGVVTGMRSSEVYAPRLTYSSPTRVTALGGTPSLAAIATADEIIGWGQNAGGDLRRDSDGRIHVATAGVSVIGRGLSTAVCAATQPEVVCWGTFFASPGSSLHMVSDLALPLPLVRWLDVEDRHVVAVTADGRTLRWSPDDSSVAETINPRILASTRGVAVTTERTYDLLDDGTVREFAIEGGDRMLVRTHRFTSPAVWLDARCNTACAVLRDGTVECTGANRSGELLRGYASDFEPSFGTIQE